MNRKLSSAEKKDSATSEELKELFTDPLLRKKKGDDDDDDAKNKKCHCSSNLESRRGSKDVESAPPTKKVVDPTLTTGNTLMNRRITIAGGFLDIALFTANVEQLKFVLELGDLHIYYTLVLGLLITSLVLQLLFGLAMFLLGWQVFQKISDDEIYTSYLNHASMGLVALITIVNIFIGTFGPKGTIMARCLGAFAYPKVHGPVWMAYLNATRNYIGNMSG